MQFKKGLAESNMPLDEANLHALFRSFDADCSGYLDFDEFLDGVRPPLSDTRKALVTEAFEVRLEGCWPVLELLFVTLVCVLQLFILATHRQHDVHHDAPVLHGCACTLHIVVFSSIQ